MSFGDFSQIPESLRSRSQWMPLTKVNGTGKRAYNPEDKRKMGENGEGPFPELDNALASAWDGVGFWILLIFVLWVASKIFF